MELLKYRIEKLIFLISINYQFLTQKIFYFLFRNKSLYKIIEENRNYLKTVEKFLPYEVYSINNYGVQKRIYDKLESEIAKVPTYSDFIIFLIKYLYKNNVNYLEIGVSVLKNFLQINNSVSNSNLVAFDINNINPNFENLDQIKKNENKLNYFKGSVLSPQDTTKFSQAFRYKFDIIFSDALHEPSAIRSEYELIIKNNLKSEFLIYYDDLDFQGVEEELINIYKDLKNYLKRELNLYTFKIYGWIGQNENLHKNGIITTIDLEAFMSENNLKIFEFKKF